MVRIKHAVSTRRRKKRLLKQAKRSLMKSMAYAYRDRRVKKRDFKRLWITRISAACRQAGTNYSRFIKGLAKANIAINRKMLADLAVRSPDTFKKLIELAK